MVNNIHSETGSVFVFNLLLGNVKLTYFGNWDHVQPQADSRLADHLYLAPGTCSTSTFL